MKKGTTLTATEKMDRSREMTKRMAARELLYAGVLARLWPAYLAPSKPSNDAFPLLLCVESPAGLLTWRLDSDECVMFDWLEQRDNAGEKATDRTPILHGLATSDDWVK